MIHMQFEVFVPPERRLASDMTGLRKAEKEDSTRRPGPGKERREQLFGFHRYRHQIFSPDLLNPRSAAPCRKARRSSRRSSISGPVPW